MGKEREDSIFANTRPKRHLLEELSADFHEEYQHNCDAMTKLLTMFDLCFKLEFRLRASADELLESDALVTC